jgi:hypothetical protein
MKEHQEMKTEGFWERTSEIMHEYARAAESELTERWKNWKLDLTYREMYEVIGALLARQVTLATSLALSPENWNQHVAPLILRSMADNYITLAWIFCEPIERSRKFLYYGLGQEKLQIEHLKKQLAENNISEDDYPEVKYREDWIDRQKYRFLTEVNLGSWSGIDTRRMAEEANCVDFYNYSFQPFTSAVHNMWNHVAKWNLVYCPNPLHRYHGMPAVRRLHPSIDFVLEGASYLDKAFLLFDEKTSNPTKLPSTFDTLKQNLDQFGRSLPKQSQSN